MMDVCSGNSITTTMASAWKWLGATNSTNHTLNSQNETDTLRLTYNQITQTILSNEILFMRKILNSIIHNKNVTHKSRTDNEIGPMNGRLEFNDCVLPPSTNRYDGAWFRRRDATAPPSPTSPQTPLSPPTTTASSKHKSHPANVYQLDICSGCYFSCNSNDTIYKSPIKSNYINQDNNNSDTHSTANVKNSSRNKPNDNKTNNYDTEIINVIKHNNNNNIDADDADDDDDDNANVTQQYNKLKTSHEKCIGCHHQWQHHTTDRSSQSTTDVCDSFVNDLNSTMCQPLRVVDDSVRLQSTSSHNKQSKLIVDPWWKHLVIVICYLTLFTSSLGICNANKHEGN